VAPLLVQQQLAGVNGRTDPKLRNSAYQAVMLGDSGGEQIQHRPHHACRRDCGINQHQQSVTGVGRAVSLAGNARLAECLGHHLAQRSPKPDPDLVVAVAPAEMLEVQDENRPVHRLDGHRSLDQQAAVGAFRGAILRPIRSEQCYCAVLGGVDGGVDIPITAVRPRAYLMTGWRVRAWTLPG